MHALHPAQGWSEAEEGCTCGCELPLGQWDGDVVVFHHFLVRRLSRLGRISTLGDHKPALVVNPSNPYAIALWRHPSAQSLVGNNFVRYISSSSVRPCPDISYAMGCTHSVRPDVCEDDAEVPQTRVTSVSRTEASTAPVETRFVPLEDLKRHGRLPRFGSSPGFVHPVTGEGNANLCRSRDSFDALSTIFIFVSHRWLRSVTTLSALALA